ncbi:hypothetical protein M8E51_004316 [Salmonella enterica]
MTSIKIYTATPADLSPPVQSESFCVDLVLASDYRELEAKCAALVAENAHARERHVFIRALAVSILEHSGGRMDWRGAMEDATELLQTVDSVYAKTPATDAFLAEVRAQGVEMFGEHVKAYNHSAGWQSKHFAAQLRKGASL